MQNSVLKAAEESISADFERAGCTASWHVVDLQSGMELGSQTDSPVILASVFKVLIALEFYAQADAGDLDPATLITLAPDKFTPGPTGLSGFEDPVSLSLRDLCRSMMAVSDNTATDVLLGLVGLDRVNARALACGCNATRIESSLRDLFDRMARDIGFADYPQLFAAQSGLLGPEAWQKGSNPQRIDGSSAFDPGRTNRSTPRDMTRLLRSIWKDEAGGPTACANTRAVMALQVSSRLGRALPDGAALAAKTGSLTGRVRNEIGVITHADGRAYAAAVFTRAHRPFEQVSSIETQMANAVAKAISALRSIP